MRNSVNDKALQTKLNVLNVLQDEVKHVSRVRFQLCFDIYNNDLHEEN